MGALEGMRAIDIELEEPRLARHSLLLERQKSYGPPPGAPVRRLAPDSGALQVIICPFESLYESTWSPDLRLPRLGWCS